MPSLNMEPSEARLSVTIMRVLLLACLAFKACKRGDFAPIVAMGGVADSLSSRCGSNRDR